ncbi:MAG: uracil-DNA glycosylase [Gammaproteobacteria bacterium]|jgi:uracil-DNA glycosylase
MSDIDQLLDRSGVHDEWRPLLAEALATISPAYLAALLHDRNWLPGPDRLLAAFRRDRRGLRYLLLGESPYPRRESANGIAFYDAAVGDLWSEQGLSKTVNRATSLRNIVKAALLAEDRLHRDADGKITQAAISRVDRHGLVQTLGEIFDNLESAGFLLFNATPVLHPERKPVVEARYWRDFLECLLASIHRHAQQPRLLLWGKIAKLVEDMPSSRNFDRLVCEHPYNLSFIDNPDIHRLFAELRVLQKTGRAGLPDRRTG